ncbi:MAG: methyltransferase family protein [Chloroflexota bacterium]
MTETFFDHFQLINLIFFLLVFLGRTFYLRIRKNIRVFTLGVGKRGWQQAVELAFFVLLAAWIIEVFLYTLPIHIHLFPAPFTARLLDSMPLKIAGAILIVIGQVIFLLALWAFKDSWRVGVDKQTPGGLVTSGMFSVSRNPIFLFMDLYFIGTFLINETLVFLIFAVIIIAGVHYQILQEERFLSQNYGKAYQEYCAKTNRYFGWRKGKL